MYNPQTLKHQLNLDLVQTGDPFISYPNILLLFYNNPKMQKMSGLGFLESDNLFYISGVETEILWPKFVQMLNVQHL